MPLFAYDFLDEKGKKISSIIEASNLLEAKQKLLKKSVYLTKISPVKNVAHNKISKKELLNLTREIARLLKAGLPLFETLSALEEKYHGHPIQHLLLDLCEQVRSGKSFSSALSTHSKVFDLLYVAMVANSEKTGRLQQTMQELYLLLSKQQKVIGQLISAFIYPSMLLSFCFVILGALLFYVVPSLQELFEGRNLHFFTKMVFAMSDFACNMKMVLLVGIVATIAMICAIVAFDSWKKACMQRLIQIPLLKAVFSKVSLIRFMRSCSTLLDGGVPIVVAFSQAKKTMNHPLLEQVITNAEFEISQGSPIHKSFASHPLIPSLVPRMLSIAEKSGQIEEMMRQIAEIYEEDLERTLLHFSTVAQPVILLFLGFIVGFVLLSVLLPLTDVNSFF